MNTQGRIVKRNKLIKWLEEGLPSIYTLIKNPPFYHISLAGVEMYSMELDIFSGGKIDLPECSDEDLHNLIAEFRSRLWKN